MEFLLTSQMEVANARAALAAAEAAQQMVVKTIFRRHEQNPQSMVINPDGEFVPLESTQKGPGV